MKKRSNNLAQLIAPIIVTILLAGMFHTYLKNIDRKHEPIIDNINKGHAAVLSPNCNSDTLAAIIFNNGYADTKADADTIASILVLRQKTNGQIPSLYTLQKRAFGQVPALFADSCHILTARLKDSYEKLGQNERVFNYNADSLRAIDSFPTGNGKITVKVVKKVESSNRLRRFLKIEDEELCVGVPVKLRMHYRDTLNRPTYITLGFLTDTTGTGTVVFEGLDTHAAYSVLPVKRGFEYGVAKGTHNGEWRIKKKEDGMSFSFVEKEHRIQLFGNATLRQIKNSKTIMVRSPQEFRQTAKMWFIIILGAWWVLFFILLAKKKHFDGLFVGACMLLTGICVLMMFSMQDPLNDELNGVSMGKGVVIGIAVCILLQFIDFVKFYQDHYIICFDFLTYSFQWLFKPYRQKIARLANDLQSDANLFRKFFDILLLILTLPFLILDVLPLKRISKSIEKFCSWLPKGIGWLVAALIITLLLFVPGIGQEVGGMKVNLKIGPLLFQPSEIAKYLILIFTAAFFTQQADTIIAYSQPKRERYFGSKVKAMTWIIVGLVGLMGLYFLLGDMGPGLVLGVTFIVLYSLIKSKVDTDNISENDRWKRIFSCDFAILVYSVISFVAFLIVGFMLNKLELFALLWLVAFALFCRIKRQFFESALMINLVISLFVFGGTLLALVDQDAGERFKQRTEMCTNTWGTIDYEHTDSEGCANMANPVSNTQVANGLWALATGGIRGQGFGNGKPSLIPAFHTDMILSSIGEQTGWIGLLMVVITLVILLRRMTITGYRTGHPFAFYLCLGFAVVIAVQFFIIALGSSGIIPLTGVTVPFLSYGRVSMILNLIAFGIVLSLSGNTKEQTSAVKQSVRHKAVEQYGYPIAIVTLVFLFFSVSTLFVWQYYQFWKRDNTLIHLAYVHNTQGAPVIEHNPRIDLLVSNMNTGRIYDRNNILLATSDKNEISPDYYAQFGIDRQELSNYLKRNLKRYYPFGEHLFFMLGDQNESLLFSYDENHPVGYMAEVQHLSYLRDFDNILYDKNGKPVKVRLKSNELKESPFLKSMPTISDEIVVRDYTALLKYLKDGIDGKLVAQHNKAVRDSVFDLHLTIDAKLQTNLQNCIDDYMHHMQEEQNCFTYFNLMRVSVVVLDANNGDLLASANYPLPDYDRLRKEDSIAKAQGKKFAIYSDYRKDPRWEAYTDRDLGTTFPTPPGSTAKIMSAIGGFRKLGTAASKVTYRITNDNAIEKDKNGIPLEPTINNSKAHHRHDPVTMQHAIVESSNCYFVNLVNDKDLYDSLKLVYSSTGISIGGITPYYFTAKSDTSWRQPYYMKINKNQKVALNNYRLFVHDSLRDPKDLKIKPKSQTNMSIKEWKWAWGQGYSITNRNHEVESFDILATPMNMARVAATVVNGGKMPVTQYLMPTNDYERGIRNDSAVQLMKPEEAQILKDYMLAESANQYSRQRQSVRFPSNVGGKTGTPVRELTLSTWSKAANTDDGWYMFFVEGDHPIAVAVRMERGVGSGHAVLITKRQSDEKDEEYNTIWKCLKDNNYIRTQ